MLVAQAERQFEWWTGEKPKEGVMEAAARGACNDPGGDFHVEVPKKITPES